MRLTGMRTQPAAGRSFGRGPAPLLVSVRSGAAVSMPGMMDTVLNLGIDDGTEGALAKESGDAAFARDTHRRFHEMYAHIVLKAAIGPLDPQVGAEAWRSTIAAAGTGEIPATPTAQLEGAVRAVFDSWNGRRAKRRSPTNLRDPADPSDSPRVALFSSPRSSTVMDARRGEPCYAAQHERD